MSERACSLLYTSAEKFYEKMGMKTKERQMEYILA